MMPHQRQSFQTLLEHAWNHSPFYRDYYGSHGLDPSKFPEIQITDLPLLPKKLLIENFDETVTDRRLKRTELERWFDEHRDPRAAFSKDFIVIHGSGTSGDVGIFAYHRSEWRIADVAMARHLPPPENNPSARTKIAYYVASHGHFGAISTATYMPAAVFETLIASPLDPLEQTLARLNAFQPEQLMGYSSSVAELAELSLAGRLKIRPKRVLVGGDKLSSAMETQIREAWGAPIHDVYAASESKYIAVREPGQENMTVLDDLNILEVLDENNHMVSFGKEGRVVLTNLYNRTLPLLRYELGDYVTMGRAATESHFSTILDIRGRANDALPVCLANGATETIHPIVLTTFYVPGLEKFQFISHGPEYVTIDYAAADNLDAVVRSEFQKMLDIKGAVKTTFEVRRVRAIAVDPKTGKLRLVRMESGKRSNNPEIITPVSRSLPVEEHAKRIPDKRVGPTNPFIAFKKEDLDKSIPLRFEEQVRKYPDRLSIKTRNFALTYDELNQAANRMARAILTIQGEETIALLLEKDAPMVAAILGVLKAGKIYVPLDPAHPRERTEAVLEDSQAKIVVSSNRNIALASEVPWNGRQWINFDELDPTLSSENLGVPLGPDTLAYILYTSGSTGAPKGVVQNHRNILYKTMTYTNDLHFCEDDRIALLSPCTFSLSVGFIFGALLNGACLYCVDVKNESFSHLANWVIDEGITVYNSVPTVFRTFTDSLTEKQTFPKLRLIHLGGEPVTERDVELYKQHFSPECIFVHNMGSNETGTIGQYFVDHATPIVGGMVPAGYAVEGMEVMVLDDAGKHLASNQIGEIALRSRYLAVGYWRKPELTEAAFLVDPEGGEKRAFRTGDLGRMCPDGCLEYLGRNDLQIKLRGQKLIISDIERTLLSLDGVKEAVVAVREEVLGSPRLVAYFVPTGSQVPTAHTLRQALSEKLPDYMIPSAYLALDALPLTLNGKVDRNALPDPDCMRVKTNDENAAPRTAMEKLIAQVWQDVLGVDRVGVYDNFFDLGGHSLLSLKAITQIEEKTGQRIQPREIILQTLGQIASVCEQRASTVQQPPSNRRLRKWLNAVTSLLNR